MTVALRRLYARWKQWRGYRWYPDYQGGSWRREANR